MLELLLQKLNINAVEYSITHTKKDFVWYSENGKLELIENGCATVCWSNISPFLVISKEEIKKANKVRKNRLIKAYKKLLINYIEDLRKARFNSYELANLELFFKKEGKEALIKVFKELVRIKSTDKRILYLNK